MCQSGQDPREVNRLLEAVLDGFWPLEMREDILSLEEINQQKLLKFFGLPINVDELISRWVKWEQKYNKRFGEDSCTRELDKFFLIKTLAEWEK